MCIVSHAAGMNAFRVRHILCVVSLYENTSVILECRAIIIVLLFLLLSFFVTLAFPLHFL